MLRIVHQSASVSYSLFPPYLLLPAPCIAGLLPASTGQTQPKIEPVRQACPRSFAEWERAEAELAAWLDGARQRIATLVAEVEDQRHRRYAWEVTRV